MSESQTKPRSKNYAYNGHGQRSGLKVSKFDPPVPPRPSGWGPIRARDLTAAICGDPPDGRSALDQRTAQKAAQ